jgi:hypothetical protein
MTTAPTSEPLCEAAPSAEVIDSTVAPCSSASQISAPVLRRLY